MRSCGAGHKMGRRRGRTRGRAGLMACCFDRRYRIGGMTRMR
jgi:hypothetical protein